MRLLRICLYWFLLFPLLGIDCCDSKKAADNSKNCTVSINMVSENKCKVTIKGGCPEDPQRSDWLMVNKSDYVTWESNPPGSLDYSISFKDKTPFQSKNGTAVVPTGAPAQIIGDDSCTSPDRPQGCDYQYSVTQKSAKNPCVDPGVRVVPPSLFLKLLHCLRSLVHSGK